MLRALIWKDGEDRCSVKSGQTIQTNSAGAGQCRQAGRSGEEWTPSEGEALGATCNCSFVLLKEDASRPADCIVWTEAEEKHVPSLAYQWASFGASRGEKVKGNFENEGYRKHSPYKSVKTFPWLGFTTMVHTQGDPSFPVKGKMCKTETNRYPLLPMSGPGVWSSSAVSLCWLSAKAKISVFQRNI